MTTKMSTQGLCCVVAMMVAVFAIPGAMAQPYEPAYCEHIINHCHGQTVPDGGIYSGFTGSMAEQHEQWEQFCFAVGSADSCLGEVPGECLEEAEIDRIHHIGLCTLEYSEYVALDDCTDTAIIDDTLQDCNEDATDRYQSHQIDECGYLTEVLQCANDSFIRHCGELGSLFGYMYSRASVYTYAQYLRRDCELFDILDSAPPPPPDQEVSCDDQVSNCLGHDLASFTDSLADVKVVCPNFYRSQTCLSQVSDNRCGFEVKIYTAYLQYICTKTDQEIRNAETCSSSAEGNLNKECSSFAPESLDNLCADATVFTDCLEGVLRRSCSSSDAQTAFDLWFLIQFPSVAGLIPQNCPVLQRFPEFLSADCPPDLHEYDDICPPLGTYPSCEEYTAYTECVNAIIRRTCGSSEAEANIHLWHVSLVSSVGDSVPKDCPAVQTGPTSVAVLLTPWILTYLSTILLVFVFARQYIEK